MKLIILGPPGTGKGTTAKQLAKEFNLKHISTGDLIRAEVKQQTPLGNKIKDTILKGDLVSDEIVLELLKKNLPKDKFILDGYPRTTKQAEQLKELTNIDKVIYIDSSEEMIIKRLTSRRTCSKCSAIYGLTIPSKKPGICDKCSGVLYQREDDKEEIVKARLKVYQKQTAPLIHFYKDKLLRINGDLPAKEVFQDILNHLK